MTFETCWTDLTADKTELKVKQQKWKSGRVAEGEVNKKGRERMWQKRESVQYISRVFLKEVTEHKEGRWQKQLISHRNLRRIMRWNPTHTVPKPQNTGKGRILKGSNLLLSQCSSTRRQEHLQMKRKTALAYYCTASNTALSRTKSKIISPKDK